MLGAISILFLTTLSTMFASSKKRNVVRHYLDVDPTKKSDAELKVFFISDIHRRKVDRKLLRKIDEDIDVVIIGGDLAEKNVPLSRIERNVQNLSQLGQVFFVWGNNDREVGESEIRKIIARYDGIVLDNANSPILGQPLWGICGTDDPSCKMVNVEAAIQNIEQYQKVLFVSHQPRVWQKIEQYVQPEMMFAGHTHGGQIRIGKYGIDQKGFFEENHGKGKLISNGYGTSTVPLRLGAPAECHIVTLSFKQ